MATATLVPLHDYLATTYEPDREWVSGEIRERSMPDEYHSAMQAFFLAYFSGVRLELGVRVRPELRVRVAADRYRLPDIALLASDAPLQAIAEYPPVLCVEILSPDDSMSEMQEKIADYLGMGVPEVWMVDPRRRALFSADGSGTHPVANLVFRESVRLTPAQIFAELDELEARGY